MEIKLSTQFNTWATHVENNNPNKAKNWSKLGDDTSPRIVLVDDEESILTSLSRLLYHAYEDIEIRTTTSAEQALSLLEQQTAHLVITDLKLPQMTGIDLAKSLKSYYPDTQSILITAYGNDAISKDANNNGCLAYLEKPFDFELLLSCVEKALKPIMEWGIDQLIPTQDLNKVYRVDPIKPKLKPYTFGKPTDTISLNNQFDRSLVDDQTKKLSFEKYFSEDLSSSQSNTTIEDTSDLKEQVSKLVSSGIKYFRAQRLAEAKRCWQNALKIDPQCSAAQKNLLVLENVIKLRKKAC